MCLILILTIGKKSQGNDSFGWLFFHFFRYRMAKNLRIIFMESSRGMSDSALQSILIDNPLKQLEVKVLENFGTYRALFWKLNCVNIGISVVSLFVAEYWAKMPQSNKNNVEKLFAFFNFIMKCNRYFLWYLKLKFIFFRGFIFEK